MDAATLLTVSNLVDNTTSLGVTGGNLDLGAGSNLVTNTGINVSDAQSKVRIMGSMTADTHTFVDGKLTINAGQLILGVGEGNGKFTTLSNTGTLSMNGGTLLVNVLGGAGNSESDSVNTYIFNVNAAATLSVGVQNGQQPAVGTAYTLLTGGGSNLTKFGSVTDTSGSMIPWAQTVTNNALTITKFVKVSTTTSVTSNVNPAVPGQAVTFTATVTPATPGITLTGTVSFFDGTTLLGTGTLSPSGMGAQATFSISTLSLGSHTITAVYNGDTNYNTSTSASFGEAVQQSTTMTMLSSSSYSAAYGQAVTFTAQVYPNSPGSTPSGTVSYYDNGVLLVRL